MTARDWQKEYEKWGSILVKNTDNKEAYSKVLQAWVQKNYLERVKYKLLQDKPYSYFVEVGKICVENIKNHPEAYSF